MRSPFKLNLVEASGAEIDVCITSPHRFFIEHQQELLPGWHSVSYLIIVLQQSAMSLEQSTTEVAAEKNRLRNKFLGFGRSLISRLKERGFDSDLFDPLSGYPLFNTPGIALDDNAVVRALLNYPLISYQQCSLIAHPEWQHCVYPATVATNAPHDMVITCLGQIIGDCQWRLNSR